MLSYTSLVNEDVPMWLQMFNIITKNTNTKTCPHIDQEDNTESSNRNMHGNRPETQHMKQSANNRWK